MAACGERVAVLRDGQGAQDAKESRDFDRDGVLPDRAGGGQRQPGPRSISAQLPEQLGAIVEEELEGILVGVRS